MINSNKIAGENIKKFIESRGLNINWIMERADIDRTTFNNMLKGIGKLDVYIDRINKLFGIEDPNFFYNGEISDYQKINYLDRKGNFFTVIEKSYNGSCDPKLKEDLEIFLELVELLDVLKTDTDIIMEKCSM
ncbi:hypothetical protein [Bacillus cereus group sp. BfR-BA-01495]|uniref:hypothetical protein n=1 Tax=Bacillus cereus group sp. BfR-BA-01495 TaxID=2920363 RepID=UPI001F59D536|nr:hypothetical protein [Bacillus cereus group sp. BfR-BA-01495]